VDTAEAITEEVYNYFTITVNIAEHYKVAIN